DGVAKVDGYLISVTNGIAFVGEKKLVRIEEAGRTAAVAALTGADAEAAVAAAEERAKEREKADERAKRSAAAKRGAASRKAREEAAKPQPAAKPARKSAAKAKASDDQEEPKPPRGRRRKRSGKPDEDGASVEADAVTALTDQDPPDAGTAPAAAEDAETGSDPRGDR